MKSEVRERTQKYTVFIADDGKEFLSLTKCKDYEGNVLNKFPEVIRTAKPFYSFDGTKSVKAYNIKSKEDWFYLCENIWTYQADMSGEYTGPGIYIAEFSDGGDSWDKYYITTADEYISNFKTEVNDYEKAFEYVISKFNT